MTEVRSAVRGTDIYGAFLQDLTEKNVKILSDDQIRERIKITRDPNATDEQKSAARNDVIESSLRLIPFVIKKLPSTGIPPEELVGKGFEVVNHCIDRWDLEHISPKTEEPPKFSSYLVGSLGTSLRGQRTVSRVSDFIPTPERIEGIANIMRKARELFLQEEHREPSQNEWYERSVRLAGEKYSVSTLESVTPETFNATQRAKLNGRARLGRSVSRGNVHGDTLSPTIGFIEDTLIDEEQDIEGSALENVTKEALEELLREKMSSLTSIERTVLDLRFGIGLNEEGKPKEPLALFEVGRVLGFTRERIRQIEAKAFRKLRHPSRSKNLEILFLYEPDEGDKMTEERNRRESTYRDILKNFSNTFIERCNRQEIVQVLAKIRNGDKDSGQIDFELLKTLSGFPEVSANQIDILKVCEKEFRTSPKIFVKEVLKNINENISSKLTIRMEEVISKSKELRE